jgi:hypothetical protein
MSEEASKSDDESESDDEEKMEALMKDLKERLKGMQLDPEIDDNSMYGSSMWFTLS